MRFAYCISLLVGCGRLDFEEDRRVAIDSSGDSVISASGVSALSLPTLVVGDGAHTCLIAALVSSNPNTEDVALRWNGVDMTLVTHAVAPDSSGVVFVYRLIAPDAGPHALAATWTGEADAILGAVSFSGTDQAECVRAVATAQGSSETVAVTIPSAPRHMTLDVAVAAGPLEAATQRPQWQATTDGAPRLVQQTTHAASAMTDSCELAVPPVAGHDLVFVGANVSSVLTSVASPGVTWQRATRSAANSNIEIWQGAVMEGAATTITYAGFSAGSMVCWVGEYTGLRSAGALDAASAAFGSSSPARPGPVVTTHSHDLLILGYSNFGQPVWGEPTEGPWMNLGEVGDSTKQQITFGQVVSDIGTWNPALTPVASDPRWEAAAAAFKITTTGISGAVSSTSGTTTNTHTWSTGGPRSWVSIGLDVFP